MSSNGYIHWRAFDEAQLTCTAVHPRQTHDAQRWGNRGESGCGLYARQLLTGAKGRQLLSHKTHPVVLAIWALMALPDQAQGKSLIHSVTSMEVKRCVKVLDGHMGKTHPLAPFSSTECILRQHNCLLQKASVARITRIEKPHSETTSFQSQRSRHGERLGSKAHRAAAACQHRRHAGRQRTAGGRA